MPLKTAALAAAIALVCASTAGAGTVVPDAVYSASFGPAYYAVPAGTYQNNIATSGQASGTIAGLPSATIEASASGGAPGSNTFFGGRVDYYATVVGPNVGPVPVDLSYVLQTSAQTVGSAQIILVADQGGFGGAQLGIAQANADASGSNPTATDDQTGALKFALMPGELVFIRLAGEASSQSPLGSAQLFADPLLSIDSSFAQTDPNYLTDYSIDLSQGVGNAVSGAPEPAAWAMILLGIGGVGTVLRIPRRRRTSAGAAIARGSASRLA
jgi:hypothetical protein